MADLSRAIRDLPQDADFAAGEVPVRSRHILRGGPAVVAAAGTALQFALPLHPMTSAEAGPCAALWLGPDEWLLLNTPAGLAASLAGLPHSLVDVSGRQIGLMLTGRRAARVLSSGCLLDLSAQAFPVGCVARTLFHKAEIVLWRRPDGFHVDVWRSFAPYVAGHLAAGWRGAQGLDLTAMP
jgi:sarcosine oxidase, subunit gamma